MKPEQLTVSFLNVGQGDAVAITWDDNSAGIIIDCYSADIMLDYLKTKRVERLDHVFLTHSDGDHIDGIAMCLQNFLGAIGSVQSIHYNHDTPNVASGKRKKTFRHLVQLIREHGIKSSSPRLHDRYMPTPTLLLEILHPSDIDIKEAAPAADTNNSSIVIMVVYKGKKVLLPGDLESRGWEWMLQRDGGPDLRADILKFPHHGGACGLVGRERGLSLNNLLELIQPTFVIISVGTKNIHSHPHPDVIKTLRSKAIPFRCTQATPNCHPETTRLRAATPCAGTIEVEISGGKIDIRPEFSESACQSRGVAS